MRAYYGFKVNGDVSDFLEKFKNFTWIDKESKLGFLGVEINSTEYVEKAINFSKLLDNYLLIVALSKNPNKELFNQLASHKKEEARPIIFKPSDSDNKFFENWKDYETFLSSQNPIKIKV